jgi:hypothetical protein
MRVSAAPKQPREGRQARPEARQQAEKGTQTALQASRRPNTETLPHPKP